MKQNSAEMVAECHKCKKDMPLIKELPDKNGIYKCKCGVTYIMPIQTLTYNKG